LPIPVGQVGGVRHESEARTCGIPERRRQKTACAPWFPAYRVRWGGWIWPNGILPFLQEQKELRKTGALANPEALGLQGKTSDALNVLRLEPFGALLDLEFYL
jgi:hypothetical protein